MSLLLATDNRRMLILARIVNFPSRTKNNITRELLSREMHATLGASPYVAAGKRT